MQGDAAYMFDSRTVTACRWTLMARMINCEFTQDGGVLAKRGPGEIFGERSYFNAGKRTLDACKPEVAYDATALTLFTSVRKRWCVCRYCR